MNDYISIISSLIIFLFPYLGRKWFNPQLLSSTVVSLGLLGTFGGIMYGLWVFSVEQIDSSIPQLLEGLKTAFLTSIAGMLAFFTGLEKKKNRKKRSQTNNYS